jgi:ABC-type glycerol-3-phosphate transport system substrate-binding protein
MRRTGFLARNRAQLHQKKEAARSPNDTALESKKRYTIRVVSGPYYMPGTKPMNVGEPLEGLKVVGEKFEELYSDTHIEFVSVPYAREWLVTQLSSGQAPDILQVNVEDVWQDIQKGWYIPLDEYLEQPNIFVKDGEPGSKKWWDIFKYQAISRGKAAPDGKMYCISLDMLEVAIFYNKDIFDKLSLSPPGDWLEFIALMSKLEETGYIPILINSMQLADWGVDLIFDQLYYGILPGIDIRKDPIREDYLQGYLDWDEICFLYKKGFFTHKDPRWIELWRILKDFRQYANADIVSADMVKLFITEKGAMLWDGSWQTQKLANDPDIKFDWGVLYLPPIPRAYSQFAKGYDTCVIGGSASQLVVSNTAISDTGNAATSERLKRCIDFLQFLTIPQNCERVVNELVCHLPNTKGVECHKELLPFDKFLQRRYTTTKWTYTFDLRFNEILVRMLELYLNDNISENEYIEWIGKNIESATESITRRKKLDFTRLEDKWQELAVLRESMEGLPDAAR